MIPLLYEVFIKDQLNYSLVYKVFFKYQLIIPLFYIVSININ